MTGRQLALCLCISGVWLGCDGSDDKTPKLPALEASDPAHLTGGHPRTTWIALTFVDAVAPDVVDSFSLTCDGDEQELSAGIVGDRMVVVDPRGELPPGTSCRLTWPRDHGEQDRVDFGVTGGQDAAVVPYDRDDSKLIAPTPDDIWLGDDGVLSIPVPDRSTGVVTFVGAAISVAEVDGFSPLTPMVVALPGKPDPESLPLTAVASMDPLATIGLFDADPNSAGYGERVPFFTAVRDETDSDGSPAHNLILFAGERLRPRGIYALVVTRRAYVSPGEPLTPSPFALRALGLEDAQTDNERAARDVLAPVLDMLETAARPAIHADDIALALRFTIRDDSHFADDLLSVYEQIQAIDPPAFTIDSATAPAPPIPGIAAIVKGTWYAPRWSADDYFDRDANGNPVPVGTDALDFTLVLPESAATTPAPLLMYQHGTPGSQNEALFFARQLNGGERDFAVAAFTDLLNREYDGLPFGAQTFQDILAQGKFPDTLHHFALTDQIAFVRMLQTFDTIDVLPLGAPDGAPDLDFTVPLTYGGISQGSVHASGFLAYAPEIRAAALIVGGGRYAATLLHRSDPVWEGVTQQVTDLTHTELYVALSFLQQGADPQDPANHAEYIYEAPHAEIPGARASILMQEGLGDTRVPPWSTQGTADTLGAPLLEPIFLPSPNLASASGSVAGNINATTTAAISQFVPAGYPDVPPTPTCEVVDETEGHFCPQSAEEAIAQRYEFLLSAIRDDVPVIAAPPTLRRESIDPRPRPPIAPGPLR